jgi:hypothetical protein
MKLCQIGIKVARLQRNAMHQLEALSCNSSQKLLCFCSNMPRNGHFQAGFEVRQDSNPNSVVGFVGNPSIFFEQVAIFTEFLIPQSF